MTRKQQDMHVRARRSLANKVIARAIEWGLAGSLRQAFIASNYDRESLFPAAYSAIARHRWLDNWGVKYSTYTPFKQQLEIGVYKDIPASEIHDIMCEMASERLDRARGKVGR